MNQIMPILKLYGERNCGTNYLHELIRANLQVEQLRGTVPGYVMFLQKVVPGVNLVRDLYFHLTFSKNLGWKHVLVPSGDCIRGQAVCTRDVSFVTITKNPYSWLLSLYRRPYDGYRRWDKLPDFDAFITAPWSTIRRERSPRRFPNPIEMWNRKNRAYIHLQREFPALTLRYEDLLADPETVMRRIATTFSLSWTQEGFINVNESTKKQDATKDFSYYRRYYLEEQWKPKLRPRSIEIINELLDEDVLEHFGYEKLSLTTDAGSIAGLGS